MSSAARHLSSIIIILSLPGVLSTQGFKVAGQRGNLLKITAQRSGLDASPRYEFPAGIGGATAREGQDARRGPAGRGGLNDKAAREASRGLERGPVSRPKTLQDLLLKTVEKGPNLRDARAAPASYKAAQPTHNLKRSAGPVSFKALHGTGPADDTSAAVSGTPALPFGASGGSEVEDVEEDAASMLLGWFGGAKASSKGSDEEDMRFRERGAAPVFSGDGGEALPKAPRIVLRYTACAGLINQHYSHIAALTLAAALDATVVMPPAVQRNSYAKYFSLFKEKNEVEWTPAPLESLLNVAQIMETWSEKGITISMAPALHPFPDMTEPRLAYPMYQEQEYDRRYAVRMHDVYMQNETLDHLVSRARKTASHHAKQLMLRGERHPPPYIVLDLPCTLFMLNTQGCLPLTSEVARSLEFSPYLVHLANQVVLAMTDHGNLEYNAVHLRIEKDAMDWTRIMGGPEVVWNAYISAMREAAFSDTMGLYVASALLTYGDSDGLTLVLDKLTHAGLCSGIHYKELYLPESVLKELNSEQSGLLDFLILYRARSFVGFGSSTFSFYLREYRALLGIPKSSSVLVNSSVITTDPIFKAAGTVV